MEIFTSVGKNILLIQSKRARVVERLPSVLCANSSFGKLLYQPSPCVVFCGPVTQSTDISEAFCLLIKNTLCNTRPVVVLRSIVASVYRIDRVNEHLFTAFTLKLSLLHAFKPQALYWENHQSLCCFLPYAAKTKISSTGTSIARSTTRREHTHGK